MQSGHLNGLLPSASNTTKHKKTTSPLKLKRSSPVKTRHDTAVGRHSVLSNVQIYEDDDDLDITPYIVRKDRLVQELESSLAEMDDQVTSTARLEEQKMLVEEERNSLLKEIEGTVTEIQNHVLNARELEIEKKAIEAECDELKSQVQHLRNLLENQNSPESELNHVGFSEVDGSLQSEHVRASTRCLEKEVQKLRLANEKLWLQSKAGKNASLNSAEKLRKENDELQKLLHLAEESEDNIAQELATCHKAMGEMKQREEEWQSERGDVAAERDQIELERAELERELEKLQSEVTDSQDRRNGNHIQRESIQRVSPEREKEELITTLKKTTEKCDMLQKDNNLKQKQVDVLQTEVQELKEQVVIGANENAELKKKNGEGSQQLRPALEKLNKENAALQDVLDKMEKELSASKVCLEEERAGKKTVEAGNEGKTEKGTTAKSNKTKKGKLGKGKETQTKKGKNEVEKDDKEEEEIEVLRKENSSLTSECQALAETVSKVASEKRKMEKEIEDLTDDQQKLESNMKELEAFANDMERLKEEKEELDKAHTTLMDLCSDLSEKLEAANQRNVSVDKQLEKTVEERNSLQNVCKEFQESIESIKKEMESVQKDVASKNNEIKVLKRKHEGEKRRLIGMKEGGDKEVSKFKLELQGISEKLPGITSSGPETSISNDIRIIGSAVDKVVKNLKDSKQKCAGLEDTKSELEKRVEAAEKQSNELQNESAKANDMAMEKSVELSRTKRALEKKIEKLGKENLELKRKAGELTAKYPPPPRISPVNIEQSHNLESEPPSFLSPLGLPTQRGPSQGHLGPRKGRSESDPQCPYSMVNIKDVPVNAPRGDPYSMGNRKLTNDTFFWDNPGERNPRVPPPYRERGVPMAPTSMVTSRPPRPNSGSMVTVIASSVPQRQEGAILVNRVEEGYSSLPRERRRSLGDQKVRAQRTASFERRHHELAKQPENDQNSAFQVVGYRKGGKVIQEHYV